MELCKPETHGASSYKIWTFILQYDSSGFVWFDNYVTKNVNRFFNAINRLFSSSYIENFLVDLPRALRDHDGPTVVETSMAGTSALCFEIYIIQFHIEIFDFSCIQWALWVWVQIEFVKMHWIFFLNCRSTRKIVVCLWFKPISDTAM